MITGKRICIVQSNYLPWKGYFDLIRHSDRFVFLDDVLYTTRNWRNRNRIKSPKGTQWLTVPVSFSYSSKASIESVRIANKDWARNHLRQIEQHYKKAPYKESTLDWLRPLLLEASGMAYLSLANHFLVKAIAKRLEIETPFAKSSELMSLEDLGALRDNNDRLVQLTKAAGGDICLNGPTAKPYTDVEYCRENGVLMCWADYSGYAEYPQLHGEFSHNVSIIDMFMMLGPEAKSYLKTERFIEA